MWLTIRKKDSRTNTVTYLQALDAALQHGWIDAPPVPGTFVDLDLAFARARVAQ